MDGKHIICIEIQRQFREGIAPEYLYFESRQFYFFEHSFFESTLEKIFSPYGPAVNDTTAI